MSSVLAAHDYAMSQPVPTGNTRFWVDRRLHGLEFLWSSDRQHSYAPHTHDTFVLGCLQQGALRYRNRGRDGVLQAGQVLVINPGDLHDCRPEEDGASYRMLYPSDDVMTAAAEMLGVANGAAPRFGASTLDDPALADAICMLQHLSRSGADAMTLESGMLSMLKLLLEWHGDLAVAPQRPKGDRVLVRRACDYLNAHLDRDVSLSELSDQLDTNRFRLIREFRKVLGITPHAYLNNRRLERAKQALSAGQGLAETALECGYWDQSHFHRFFKRSLGVTPKAYRDACLA